MSYELYEVWAEDENGHEELIETTRSLKQAEQIAKKVVDEGFYSGVIYQETEDGDLEEVDRFESD